MRKQDHDQQLAERFACSTRSIRRMRSKGVDLNNPLAIADYIIESRSATLPQLTACMAVVLKENQRELEQSQRAATDCQP